MEEQKLKKNPLKIIEIIVFFAIIACFLFALIYFLIFMPEKNFAVQLTMRLIVFPIMLLPFLISKIFKITFPSLICIAFYLFMLISMFLGSFMGLYQILPFYDFIVHVISGVLFGLISLCLLPAFCREKNYSAFFAFLFVFSFALMIGGVWEIYEFTVDGLLGQNCQRFMKDGVMLVGRDALLNTMTDLIADAVGALIAGLIALILALKNKDFITLFQIRRKKKIEENYFDDNSN